MITVNVKHSDSLKSCQIDREKIIPGSLIDSTISFQEKNGNCSDNIVISVPDHISADAVLKILEWMNVNERFSFINEKFSLIDESFSTVNKGSLLTTNIHSALDFLNIEASDFIELSSIEENFMRDNMYKEEYSNHEINTDPYYALVEITEQVWDDYSPVDLSDREDLLFHNIPLTKNSWEKIRRRLSKFDFLLRNIPGLYLAGGKVFSALFNKPSADIDLFMTGCDTDEIGADKIRQIAELINQHYGPELAPHYGTTRYVRSANAVTIIAYEKILNDIRYRGFELSKKEIQVILRAYRTPSEIIHGFDVDSCSFLYDGYKIFATKRAIFSINHGFNTVSFSRLSPSYPYRLAKYGTKGVAVKVPEFSRAKVNNAALLTRYEERTPKYDAGRNISFNFDDAYSHLNELTGLNIILYLEFYYSQYLEKTSWRRIHNSVSRLSEEHSDYSVQSFAKYAGGEHPYNLVEYLIESSNKYPGMSEKYLPILQKILKIDDDEMFFIVNSDEDCWKFSSIFFKYLLGNIQSIFPNDSNLKNKNDIYEMIHLFGKYFPAVNHPLLNKSKKIFFARSENLEAVLSINQDYYDLVSVLSEWQFTPNVEFIRTNPGQQMTNTFNKLVLEDNSEWYKGEMYDC